MTAATTSRGASPLHKLTAIGYRYPLILVIIIMAICFQVSTGSFWSGSNLRGIASDIAPLVIVSVPMAMLIISGYLDLSVGSSYALGAVAAGWYTSTQGAGLLGSVIIALAAGVLVGAINGVLCTYLGLSSFIVTLGTLTAGRGLAQQLAPLPLTGFSPGFAWLGGSKILGVPAPVIIAAVALLIGGAVLALLPVGRHIYAIGVSREAAFLSGIRVRFIPFIIFVSTGAMAAFAGAIKASVLGAVQSGTSGLGFELSVLTAVLIGGVALTGGYGSLIGVALGAVFLGVLQNGLTLIGVPTFWQQVAQGVALVAAAGLAFLSPKLQARAAQLE